MPHSTSELAEEGFPGCEGTLDSGTVKSNAQMEQDRREMLRVSLHKAPTRGKVRPHKDGLRSMLLALILGLESSHRIV